MKLIVYITLAMLFTGINCSGQIITLKGKVTDEKTGEGLPGASIISGLYGTSADGNGEFIIFVQKEVAEKSGLTVSNIGYKNLHVIYNNDTYHLRLTPVTEELQTVVISGGAEFIVQKAYRQISVNYLNKNFNMIGLQQMEHSISDIFGYQYYYRSNAKIKLYLSAYSDTAYKAQVAMLAKKDVLANNPDALKINFIDGYRCALSHDFVHNRITILKGNTDKFSYRFNCKEWLNGMRVYVINFYSKKGNKDAGILYIDSASYAFVKILRTENNITSRFIELDKVTTLTQYSKFGDRWALDAVVMNSITQYHGYNVERMEEVQVAVSDVATAAPLPAKAVILRYEIDDKTNPYPDFSSADKKIPAGIKKLADRIFIKTKVPDIAVKVHKYADI
jgi:hypothetical protein